ncbi:hypothetical protein H4S07_005097 [Coemansia furcata]|uniref:Uncharacterized protein n=1 Tax=Coemansia furcata TaxID=417177 RepID=A0ACC1L4C4_9FUNG|nr:hypothetical protein H4S07_005097 [Coemansia furcata]
MADSQAVETTIVWADGAAESVAIRGTFSRDSEQWWTETIPLRREGSSHRAVLTLEPGRYEFKYVVDGEWRVNSSKYQIVNDGYGNSNNMIIVSATAHSNTHSGHADTALSIDDQPEIGDRTSTYNSEYTRLLATRPDGTKSVAGYSGNQSSVHDDEDCSSLTADGGEDRHSAEAAEGGSGSDDSIRRTWSVKRIVVGTLMVLFFGLLGVASALWYD